jgi:DNA polymerase III subunit delta
LAKKKSGLSIPALKSQLAVGKIAPVYLIEGKEPFLANDAVASITEAINKQYTNCSAKSFEGADARLADVLDSVRTMDMFSPARLTVVASADKLMERHWDALAAYAASPPKDGYLLLLAAKANRSRKMVKTVEASQGLVVCNRIYPSHVMPWIMERISLHGCKIDSGAAALLADFLGTDLATIDSELEKLATYIGDRKAITVADVEAVSLRDRGREIYELTDAIGSRNAEGALTILDRLLEQSSHPSPILYVVSRHLRRLWSVKELLRAGLKPVDATRKVGVNYFIERFLAQVDAFSLGELRRSSHALTRCEAELKSSGVDPRILFETTLIGLVQRRRPAAARTR